MTGKPNPYYQPISDAELLAPSAILAIDANMFIDHLLQHELLGAIVSPEDGYYLPWSKTPYLPVDTYYPVGHLGNQSVAVTDLDQVLATEVHLVRAGNPGKVINPAFLKAKKKLFSRTPSYNEMAINLIYAYAVRIINYLAPVNRWHTVCFSDINAFLIEDYDTSEVENAIEAALDPLFIMLKDFIGNDTWHLYTPQLKGTSIIIEKIIDYRIYDWYQIQRQQHDDDES